MKKLSLILLTSLMAVPLAHAANSQSHIGALIEKAQQQSQVRQRRQTTPPAASAATPIQTSQPKPVPVPMTTTPSVGLLSTSPSQGGLAHALPTKPASTAAAGAAKVGAFAGNDPETEFQRLTAEVKRFMREAQIIETMRQKQLPEDMRQKVKILIDKTKIDNHGNPITDKDGNPLYNRYNNDPTDLTHRAESQKRRCEYLINIVRALQGTADPEISKGALVDLEAELQKFKNTQWKTKEKPAGILVKKATLLKEYFENNNTPEYVQKKIREHFQNAADITAEDLYAVATQVRMPIEEAIKLHPKHLTLIQQYFEQEEFEQKERVNKGEDNTTIVNNLGILPEQLSALLKHPLTLKAPMITPHAAKINKKAAAREDFGKTDISKIPADHHGARPFTNAATGQPIALEPQPIDPEQDIHEQLATANQKAKCFLEKENLANLSQEKNRLKVDLDAVSKQIEEVKIEIDQLKKESFKHKEEILLLTEKLYTLNKNKAILCALEQIYRQSRVFQKAASRQMASNGSAKAKTLGFIAGWAQAASDTFGFSKTDETPEQIWLRIAHEIAKDEAGQYATHHDALLKTIETQMQKLTALTEKRAPISLTYGYQNGYPVIKQDPVHTNPHATAAALLDILKGQTPDQVEEKTLGLFLQPEQIATWKQKRADALLKTAGSSVTTGMGTMIEVVKQ